MSQLKNWLVSKYLQIETQAVKAIDTANFYGNLFTERQRFYILAAIMAMMTVGGASSAAQFVGLVYIMNKLTPEDKDEN